MTPGSDKLGRPPNDAKISADPSGRYLLLTYGGRAGFSTGWINDSKLRLLPITRISDPGLGKDGRRRTT